MRSITGGTSLSIMPSLLQYLVVVQNNVHFIWLLRNVVMCEDISLFMYGMSADYLQWL